MAKKKKSENNFALGFFVSTTVILGFLFLGVLALCGTYEPMVDVQLKNWYINDENESEAVLYYWVMNYGDEEAHNVNVKCFVLDENGTTLFTIEDDFGNIASHDVTTKDLYIDNIFEDGKLYIVDCYVKSCDDCVILSEEIPQLRSYYTD